MKDPTALSRPGAGVSRRAFLKGSGVAAAASAVAAGPGLVEAAQKPQPKVASGKAPSKIKLDVNGKTMEAGFTELPWSVTVSTTDPGVLANVVAQGDTDALGCRILVDDKLVTEDFAEGVHAQAFCLDKAA